MRAEEWSASDLASRSERALTRALMELGFSIESSPVPYHEAQLATGCTASIRDCGSQVASVLDSEQLLITALEPGENAVGPSLRLYRLVPRAPARVGTAQLPQGGSEELELTVRALVESVFSDVVETRALASEAKAELKAFAAPVELPRAAQEAPAPRPVPAALPAPDTRRRALLGAGWSSVVLGAAFVGVGFAQNAAAHREGRAYEDSDSSSREQVDAKLAHYESAQGHTRAAQALWGAGGALLGAGAFVLLWERFAPAPDRKLHSPSPTSSDSPGSASSSSSPRSSRSSAQSLRVSAAPAPRGFSLSLRAQL